MTAALVHAHDSRVHFKLDEMRVDLDGLRKTVVGVGTALDADDRVLTDARLRNKEVMDRLHEMGNDLAILREMLGVR